MTLGGGRPFQRGRRLLVGALTFGVVAASAAVAVAPAATAASFGLVAAYSFNEGSGTAALDASGQANHGTTASTAWTTAGKFGGALTFNGSSSRVTVPDALSLHLTSAMTLEAWVRPTAVSSAWRDVIFKGNDNYYLNATSTNGSRPAAGALFSGTHGEVYAPSALTVNTWAHLASTYDGSSQKLYVDGNLVASRAQSGPITISSNPLEIGSDHIYGLYFAGQIDEVRVYDTALSQAQVQTDMNTAIGGNSGDTEAPTVAITAPSGGAQVSDITTVTASASDNVAVTGVQFFVDGTSVGTEDAEAPYQLQWDTRTVTNGSHSLTARARDGAGNIKLSTAVTVAVANSNGFHNDILATGFTLPTTMEFMPDNRLLVAELGGTIKVLSPPYTQASPTPFLTLTNVGTAGVQQGIYDIALDPAFDTNHYYYVFYTLGSPNRDRLSRFTANAALTGTVTGSEFVLYQDPQDADTEHHGGAIMFDNAGFLYYTTGEHFIPELSQQLNNPRGKLHRINKDGTVPTDNPFYDGAGPNIDSIWSYGLRNPFRAFHDVTTDRIYLGEVGGNDASTAIEELNLAARGANFGWPNSEGACAAPCVSPVYSYAHNGRDACIVAGFIYRGTQFPQAFRGSLFIADYTQNWIRSLTLNAAGAATGVTNFEPPDGSVDGPYGDIVDLKQGPEGSLYYMDLGYSDEGGTFGVSRLRRISYSSSNQAPVAVASATPTSGTAPLAVQFSSTGSNDPEGVALTYSWTFGDGTTSTAANPSHTYSSGSYTARLTVSDGTSQTTSSPITITVGSPPTATVTAPTDGATFAAGDVITYTGTGTDPDDGTLPASAFTWNIDFLHDGHVHPGTPITGVKSGTFTVPTSGHDFSGNTRYRITLTVKDSSGLSSTSQVTVFPRKVNLSFATAPAGLTLYLDGIAKATPFVFDTLVGYQHSVEARTQTSGGTTYTFSSWSDGGAATHTITVPTSNASFTATFAAPSRPLPVAAYSFNQGSGTQVPDSSGQANHGQLGTATWSTAGKNGGALAFNGTTSRVTVPDSASLHLTTGMTLEAWVFPTNTTSTWKDIVYKGDDTFYITSSSPNFRPAVGVRTTGAPVDTFGTAQLPVNTWSHVAATYDATTVRLYVNGVEVATRAKTGSLMASTQPLEIGGDHIYGSYFTGRLDDVRVYSSALTAAQIQQDMAAAVG